MFDDTCLGTQDGKSATATVWVADRSCNTCTAPVRQETLINVISTTSTVMNVHTVMMFPSHV